MAAIQIKGTAKCINSLIYLFQGNWVANWLPEQVGTTSPCLWLFGSYTPRASPTHINDILLISKVCNVPNLDSRVGAKPGLWTLVWTIHGVDSEVINEQDYGP